MKSTKLFALLAVLALVVAACTAETTTTTAAGNGDGTGVLAAVQARGELNCGVNNLVPGFGFVDEDGNFSGFDIDYCKAVAAAVLGDADAVNYLPLEAGQRFTALQSGEIDVLIRNTTFTATRDGAEGATFVTTTFYDGQGMMVRADSGFTSIEDMAGVAVCVLTGTTTEMNLANRFGDIPYTPLTFADNDLIQAAFIEGQCDGWTSDKSQLASRRAVFPADAGGSDSLVILDETFSKEPLGPVVRDGDSQWAQIVDWVVLVTIAAEELGITAANVGTFGDSEVVAIRRLLGLEITDADGLGCRGRRPGPRAGLAGGRDRRGRKLRRDLRPERDTARCPARSELAVDRRWPALRAALLIPGGRNCEWGADRPLPTSLTSMPEP